MNSTQALDYALAKLERVKISPQRADALDRAIELQQAVTTLQALRETIVDIEREQLRSLPGGFCTSGGGVR